MDYYVQGSKLFLNFEIYHLYSFKCSGLDPASPLFNTAKNDRRIDKDDAEFVDIIHTDSFARGVLRASGHLDHYVNGGVKQPGCNGSQNQSL